MEGLIIRLSWSRLFGPPPKTKEHVKHLKERLGVSTILNICPITNERTKKGMERAVGYKEFFIPEDDDTEKILEEKAKLFMILNRVPFDLSEFVAHGRTKGLQQESLARYYVQHAKLLKEKYVLPKDCVVYIHGVTGIMEEAYITFALWYMCAEEKDLPVDLLQWIKEKNYEWLFDDDADKKQLLTLILNEVRRGQKKVNFFKKVK
jgi:hypothetical protein